MDELLEHTKDIKPDLAAEIKRFALAPSGTEALLDLSFVFPFSDNHLKISFSGIEQGFSFQGLLGKLLSMCMRTRLKYNF